MLLRIFNLFILLSAFCLNATESKTLEEKIGQLLMPHFNGSECNEEALKLINETHVGGFIYYKWANELSSPEQVKALSEGLQKASKTPLWISIDQEGGPVAPLDETFGKFVGQKEALKVDHLDYYPFAGEGARMLKALGINMNLAPVFDISTGSDCFMDSRTYGDNPDVVIDYGKMALLNYKHEQILAVVKHFPGYGSAVVDPHFDLPVSYKTLSQLASWDLKPYHTIRGLYNGVMTAHVMFPQIDPEWCASLSPLFHQYLREKLKFEGLIITDSLCMGSVIKVAGSLKAAAIQALNAGADLLIIGGNKEMKVEEVLQLHAKLVKAVKKGKIPLKRVEEAYKRNMSLKKLYLESAPIIKAEE